MKPIEHFEAVWNRCALLSGLHAYLDNNVSAILQPDELLRAEWVSRVSALDLYIHELIAQTMTAIFDGQRPTTPAYMKFQLSNEVVARIRTASSKTAASSAYDLYVREQIGHMTYQFPDDIADGIRLCSTIELWNEIALKFGASASKKCDVAKDIKRQLSIIVRRRNCIAHEGDLRQMHPRDPWPINRVDLIDVSNCIEEIARTIDELI